jgi:septum formation inhibitor MinC
MAKGWNPHKLCKVCNVCKVDESLFKRIALSRQFVNRGETLTDIHEDYKDKFSYQSLYSHVKKHQAPTADILSSRRLAKVQEQVMVDQFKRSVQTKDARQDLLDKLFNKLESGDFDDKMSVKDLLSVLRDTDNAEAKKKDQEIDIMKMMMPYRSGDVVQGEYEEYNPWEEK